jgi:hypothetical protein
VWIEKAKRRKKMGCGGLSCEEKKGQLGLEHAPFFALPPILFY